MSVRVDCVKKFMNGTRAPLCVGSNLHLHFLFLNFFFGSIFFFFFTSSIHALFFIWPQLPFHVFIALNVLFLAFIFVLCHRLLNFWIYRLFIYDEGVADCIDSLSNAPYDWLKSICLFFLIFLTRWYLLRKNGWTWIFRFKLLNLIRNFL